MVFHFSAGAIVLSPPHLSLSPISLSPPFPVPKTSRPVLGHTQPPMQWTAGAISLGIKWQGCEDDHSPQSGAKVMKKWSMHSDNFVYI